MLKSGWLILFETNRVVCDRVSYTSQRTEREGERE